jgi:hypothetical protein
MVDISRRLETILPSAEVQQQELVCIDVRKFRLLDVDAANPVPALLEKCHKMMADEPTGSSDNDPLHTNTPSPIPALAVPRSCSLCRTTIRES